MTQWLDYLNYLISALVAALVAAVVGLVRKVLTNEKEIAILREQLKAVDRIESEVSELRTDIKDILFRLTER